MHKGHRLMKEERRMFNAVRRFPEGTNLKNELEGAMKRLGARGVRYPIGYLDKLVTKYTKIGIAYPRILMRLGEPLILKHGHYKEVLGKGGKFLDFGCGTGDDIRQLIMDGYPKKDILGFDIDWKSLNLGFDLYNDRSRMKGNFIVSKEPHFKDGTFDIVYSGSVLHTLKKMADVNRYLDRVRNALRTGGIFFGSTLGSFRPMNKENRTTFVTKRSFHKILRKKRFRDIHLVGKYEKQYTVGKRRYIFFAVKE